jgi:predicted ATPase/GAF domain-containing protein/HPt (histidine-containing phosphotransfer) domain-containing protein
MEDLRAGYILDTGKTLYSARVRRGQRKSDGAKVVIKAPRGEYPSLTEVARVRSEYALLKELAGAPVPQVFDLVRLEHGVALVLEDVGKDSFHPLIVPGGMALPRFLRLARLAAETLDVVHARGFLHKDIKPQHFFADASESRVWLVDFDVAVRVEREEQASRSLDALEGTLAYMSPEQTGRMSRSVDRRSDLYSLGATFYQLLTGVLPFETEDPLELVHSHIARVARPPADVAGVPRVVSDIVMRLLEKAPEARYQTASGLAADLARCERELAEHGSVQPFLLGEQDFPHELRIPEKLYGRRDELALLRRAVERVKGADAELVLLRGGAGVGKSALVRALQDELGVDATFAAGKFNQFNRALPYAALARAAGELVRAELAGSPAKLAQWKSDLLAAIGQNGQVLIDLVPELELVLGAQPAVVSLGAAESQNRFENSFQRFIQVSASEQKPLILALDDLQWADAASLRLLRLILQHREQGHLLVLGCYRDSEVGVLHPLTDFLTAISDPRAPTSVELGPLASEHVAELLNEALPRTAQSIAPLAELVTSRTGGNPFFVGQFVESLHRDGHLRFDSGSKRWTWQVAAIAAAAVPANVVELVLAKLQRLGRATQETLKFAACIGNRFDARTVAAISGRSLGQVAESLSEAVREGFVVPLDANHRLAAHVSDGAERDADVNATYRFGHDRVQAAAYGLIPEAERAPIHLAVGRELLARAGGAESADETIFEIVTALNQGRHLLTDRLERLELATLDIRAARRAKSASAPATAFELSDVALELLRKDERGIDHKLAHAAHVVRAECSHLIGKDVATFESIELLMLHAETVLERVEVGNLHTLILTHQARLLEARAVALETLAFLGVSLPDPNDPAALGQAIGQEFGAFQAKLAGRSVESLTELEPMVEKEKLALLEAYAAAIPAAFQTTPELMVVLVLKGAQAALDGTGPLSGFFYTQYAIVHIVATSDSETAYRFGRLGYDLNQTPETRAQLPPICFLLGMFIAPWTRPLRETIEIHRQGARVGFEVGDQMHANYCFGGGLVHRLIAGESLDSIQRDIPGYLQTLRAAGDIINVAFVTLNEQTVRCLKGEAASLAAFDGETEFEAGLLPPIAAMYGALKAMLRYLARRPAEALAATDHFHPLPAMFYGVEYSFYRALSLIELAREEQGEERAARVERLQAELALHERWARACPQNFAQRLSLVQAEHAALEGRVEEAMALYERAIAEALSNEHPQHVALANELCGRFHLRAERPKVARVYLVEACYQYQRWGASAKVAQLVSEHAGLDLMPRETAAATAKRSTTTGAGSSGREGELDLMSAMRATQAIASELVLDRLVERLVRILVENAGAQRGCLIIDEPEGLRVAAAMSVDPDLVQAGLRESLDSTVHVPASLARYVARSREAIVLDDASRAQRFARDPYFQGKTVRSALCVPLIHQGELSAVLYLEHAAVAGAFTATRMQRLEFLGSHAAVAVENAKLYRQVAAATERLADANQTLEHKVKVRTRELEGRNADMRRVLDTVTQGLITIDPEGCMAAERSAAAERWFGSFQAGDSFAQYVSRSDPAFADWFSAAFPMYAEDILPTDVAISQLPTRLLKGEREYRVTYLPVLAAAASAGLLIVIDDVTDSLQRARAEADLKEQLALFGKLEQDRVATLGFFKEGAQIVTTMQQPNEELVTLKRALHTLKGNAAMLELTLLADRCHQAEEAVIQGVGFAEAIAPVLARWKELLGVRDALVGAGVAEDRIEVERAAVARLIQSVERGAPAHDVSKELVRWTLQRLEYPLRRLGDYATSVARRLHKAEAVVTIADGGLLGDPNAMQPLSSVLVHLIRNAIDHGFESASERAARGKPAVNKLHLEARLEQGSIVIAISDDGHGIDWRQISAICEERGLPSSTHDELVTALVSPGFTTRGDVSDTSGRGIGLSAVVTEIERLGGTLGVDSELGRGCTWSIRVPARAIGGSSGESLRPGSRSQPPPRSTRPSAAPAAS